jgi:hypothetical protein
MSTSGSKTAATGERYVGSDGVAVHGHAARPTGTVHVVDASWRPECGAARVKFVFPGADAATVISCPACAKNLAVSGAGGTSVA